jgi:hypothetical protein
MLTFAQSMQASAAESRRHAPVAASPPQRDARAPNSDRRNRQDSEFPLIASYRSTLDKSIAEGPDRIVVACCERHKGQDIGVFSHYNLPVFSHNLTGTSLAPEGQENGRGASSQRIARGVLQGSWWRQPSNTSMWRFATSPRFISSTCSRGSFNLIGRPQQAADEPLGIRPRPRPANGRQSSTQWPPRSRRSLALHLRVLRRQPDAQSR